MSLSDLPGSPPAHRKSAQLQNLVNLEKQLAIEQRVKSGAETMILVYSGIKNRQEKRLLSEAQQMFSDSKIKVEVLRMKIMKIKGVANAQASPERTLESSGTGEAGSRSKAMFSQTPDGRLAILRYRIDVETRLMQGARTIMKANPNDRKSWQTVSLALPFLSCFLNLSPSHLPSQFLSPPFSVPLTSLLSSSQPFSPPFSVPLTLSHLPSQYLSPLLTSLIKMGAGWNETLNLVPLSSSGHSCPESLLS